MVVTEGETEAQREGLTCARSPRWIEVGGGDQDGPHPFQGCKLILGFYGLLKWVRGSPHPGLILTWEGLHTETPGSSCGKRPRLDGGLLGSQALEAAPVCMVNPGGPGRSVPPQPLS